MDIVLGPILAKIRKQEGIRQNDLACTLGISPTYLSDIEAGRRRLQSDHITKLPPKLRDIMAGTAADLMEAEAQRLRAIAEQTEVK